MCPTDLIEIVDLSGPDVEAEPLNGIVRRSIPATNTILESPPAVRLGALTISLSLLTSEADCLSGQLLIRRDSLSTEFQLAVLTGQPDGSVGLPLGYIPQEIAQLFERALIGDYVNLSAEISQKALKRFRLKAGQPNSRSVPLTIMVSVRPAFITAMFRLLKDSNLPFIFEPAIFAMIKAQLSQNPLGLHSPASVSLAASSSNINPNIVWRLLDNALNAIPFDCKAVDPHPCVRACVYDYQKSGLGWMIAREQTNANSEFQQVFWNKLTNEDGTSVYHNFFTSESSPAVPNGFKGGILADEMGLGKTLQVIALIVSNSRKVATSDDVCSLGPTLIVCPVSVVGNWVDQFKRHIHESAKIQVHVYHGSERFKQHLDHADVIITTYSTLAADYKPLKEDSSQRNKIPIFAKKWLRLVLDEAHIIRSQRSLQHAAAIALDADRRWCLSGTPIQNHLDDFYSLLKFLRAEPLDDFRTWNGAVVTPFKSGSTQGTERVQAIFRAVCLRRTKASEAKSVDLPPKEVFFIKVVLSDVEKRLYNMLMESGRARFSEMLKAGKLLNGYAGVLELLLRMRMCCSHPNLVPAHYFDSVHVANQIERNPIEILSDVLQESSDEDCCYCLQPLTDACITKCAHLFCRHCITTFITSHHCCPVCSSSLDDQSILRPKLNDSVRHIQSQDCQHKAAAPYLDPSFVSSKIAALLDQLRSLRSEDPSIKSVLFSQWVGMLSIVEDLLVKEGFVVRRLDGSMSRALRESAIESFQNDPHVTIMVISLQAGNVGLTLTSASRVFILDLWYNPGLEQQAIDRVHRVGQTRPVFIYRFIAMDTVEEKILHLQEKKKNIMKQTLSNSKSSAKNSQTVLDEINYLFS